jgi:hypothetical protein
LVRKVCRTVALFIICKRLSTALSKLVDMVKGRNAKTFVDYKALYK